jgi:O-antigen ligase
MVVALLLGITVVQNRTRLALRVLSAVAIALVGLAFFAPTVMGEIGHQLSAVWGATQGSAADASVQGHLSDISIGWDAVKASPITGLGPNGHLAGLVVQGGGPLYVHNEVLESWLRFGLLGAILVVAVQVVLLVQGLIAIRRGAIDFTVRWAALLLVMAPVAMLTAPFLTTTQRWPAILGFAAGLIAPVLRASSR